MSRPRPLYFKIIQHDCRLHEGDYREFGPFTTREAAEQFIERHELGMPLDGGYAFAAVVLAHPDETPAEWESPAEWDKQADADELL
jgi:hypothetical protein